MDLTLHLTFDHNQGRSTSDIYTSHASLEYDVGPYSSWSTTTDDEEDSDRGNPGDDVLSSNTTGANLYPSPGGNENLSSVCPEGSQSLSSAVEDTNRPAPVSRLLSCYMMSPTTEEHTKYVSLIDSLFTNNSWSSNNAALSPTLKGDKKYVNPVDSLFANNTWSFDNDAVSPKPQENSGYSLFANNTRSSDNDTVSPKTQENSRYVGREYSLFANNTRSSDNDTVSPKTQENSRYVGHEYSLFANNTRSSDNDTVSPKTQENSRYVGPGYSLFANNTLSSTRTDEQHANDQEHIAEKVQRRSRLIAPKRRRHAVSPKTQENSRYVGPEYSLFANNTRSSDNDTVSPKTQENSRYVGPEYSLFANNTRSSDNDTVSPKPQENSRYVGPEYSLFANNTWSSDNDTVSPKTQENSRYVGPGYSLFANNTLSSTRTDKQHASDQKHIAEKVQRPSRRIAPKQREHKVSKSLYKDLMKHRLLSKTNVFYHHCCPKKCFYRWI